MQAYTCSVKQLKITICLFFAFLFLPFQTHLIKSNYLELFKFRILHSDINAKKKSIVKQFVRMKSILSNNIKPFTQKNC